jgi:F-box-like
LENMASATDLPTEIILHIFSYVPPNDIESLASTCKRYYYVAQEILVQHRLLKIAHGSVSNNLSTFMQLIGNPHLAWYVRHLVISGVLSRYTPCDEYKRGMRYDKSISE